MGAGAFIEPLVVVSLLFGGTWVNRNTSYRIFDRRRSTHYYPSSYSSPSSSGHSTPRSSASLLDGHRVASPSLLAAGEQEPYWRKREIRVLGWRREVVSPNTKRFEDRFLSRLLRKFPFLVEAWYWALIYWVYQLGRAFTAVTLVESTVDVARNHALQIIHLEQRLYLFFELPIQHWFLKHPLLLHWTNRIYSFIHIPGTILFLVWLYYYTTPSLPTSSTKSDRERETHAAGPKLYAARRRTMAVCNLIAFIVFTLWPCMPPRLLSDKDVPGKIGKEARSYGFVDTVHGKEGESSVWTQNKFCNQYAAMPSLHFGYSLLIGLTIMTIPLSPRYCRSSTLAIPWCRTRSLRLRIPGPGRVACLAIGIAYPAIILVAIIATANHFVLDAVAGACVCGAAWVGNRGLLNLLWVEDWFLWGVGIHKPERSVIDEEGEERGFVKGELV
ncbi:integral membrane protein [Byssothecium circinans]|uniref:Integral membrane protein n=1 Tax=Byssothecium circinans TaxID=147558 RepID=A0A6A5U7W1_9PLEO|nr:integral membrane protein [Byssothecium circinans]